MLFMIGFRLFSNYSSKDGAAPGSPKKFAMRLASKAKLLFERVVENDDSAKAAVFLQLCREWPALRKWLWGDFAVHDQVRKRFAKILDEDSEPGVDRHWLAEFSGEAEPWRNERALLLEQLHAKVIRSYGGLSYGEIIKLIQQYEAGALDLGTFLLVRDWVDSKGTAKKSIRLMRSAAEFVDAVILGQKHLLSHVGKSMRLLEDYQNKTKRRTLLGPARRWKLNILVYILRNPQPSYQSRELRAYLRSIGLAVDREEIRKFCIIHKIRRDILAGRPRRKATLRKDL